MTKELMPQESQFVFYTAEDGVTKVQVRLVDEMVWLTQKQIAELFQKAQSTINEHIKNIYEEKELEEAITMRKFGNPENSITKPNYYYNLDVIIAVGYRVKSPRGTQFRIWASQRLKEYIVKGFTMDDERLKQPGMDNYFSELLARIRDIRSSEKVFWRKVLDIYATSVDYNPQTDDSKLFFATIQNKMHWAVHGHTAAEIIAKRADAEKPYMGLTSWTGAAPRKTDIEIAKNYLDKEELDVLNRIVNMYLEYAELQAKRRKPMYMSDWINKLDDFLKLNDRQILKDGGAISHELAVKLAHAQYEKYHKLHLNDEAIVEKHFFEAIQEVKHLETDKEPMNNDGVNS